MDHHMGFKIVGTLHIIVCGDKDPTMDDWAAYMQALQEEERKGVDVSQWRTVTFSDGGGPNATQRKAVSDLLKGRASPIAIITANSVMRGVITALSWFNPKCRAYAPSDMGSALNFLGVPLARFDSIKQTAQEIQRTIRLRQVRALDEARLAGSAMNAARL
jgi:hypothetical protein